MIKPITFRNREQQLVGVLHIPDTLKKMETVPGVVMFHGFAGNKVENHRLFVHTARSLSESGFVVLRFDFRGSGDSDGEFEDMTIPGETSDAEQALTCLGSQRWVDKEAMGVLGLSMGGRVAAILASRDRRVKFLILYSAALGPLRPRFMSDADGESWKAREDMLNSGEAVKVRDGWYLKKPFFDTVDDTVPLNVIGRISVPMLIVHGEKDEVVPQSDSTRAFEIVRNLNRKNELYIIEGGDHVFLEKEHTQKVIKKTREWLSSLNLITKTT